MVLLLIGNGFAQDKAGKVDDLGRIVLNTYLSRQMGDIPASAQRVLGNKLSQLVTKNGVGGSVLNPQFIITPTVTVLTQDLTATAPPMTALTLEVALYIGDGVEGTLLASTTLTVKGVGTNETKAYMAALKQISTKNPTIADFITEGKTKIVQYYTAKCDFILKEAAVLTANNEFDAAILKLTAVPDVCKDCYDKCMEAVLPIFQKKIDRVCQLNLTKAQNAWNAGQDEAAAKIAGKYLAEIDPNAACYKDALTLSDQIAERIKTLDEREWKAQMKREQDGVDLAKQRINAAKAVGVAHGNNQPKNVSYNVKGWW